MYNVYDIKTRKRLERRMRTRREDQEMFFGLDKRVQAAGRRLEDLRREREAARRDLKLALIGMTVSIGITIVMWIW